MHHALEHESAKPSDGGLTDVGTCRSTPQAETGWLQRTIAAGLAGVEGLTSSPWSLLCALLLVNAITQPYGAFVHDSRLYAVQVLDRVQPGQYGDDLYLRYGSQDRYSAFSAIAAPLTRWVGLPTAFFLLYLCGNTLFFFALQRFILRVVKHRLTAVLALFYVAANNVPFGGLEIFHVYENFLTPRLPAVALVLLALEQLLQRRMKLTVGLLALAMLLHPIMAFAGVLVALFFWLGQRLGVRQMLALTATVGIAGVLILLVEPWATAIFGEMDAAWRRPVQAANFYSLPLEWMLRDWLRIGLAFAVACAAWARCDNDTPLRRLLASVIGAAALGIGIGVVVPLLPYALLFQGQPYRALWLLQLLHVPLTFLLIQAWWRQAEAPNRCLSVNASLALAGLAIVELRPSELAAALLLLGLAGVHLWASAKRLRALKLGSGVALPLTLAIVAAARLVSVMQERNRLVDLQLDVFAWVRMMPDIVGPLATFAAILTIVAFAIWRLRAGHRFQAATVAVGLAIQLMFFTVSNLDRYAVHGLHREQDVAFVDDYLAARYDAHGPRPTVHWPLASMERLWIKLRTTSYFSRQQVAGNMFNRDTALEGQRRAGLVQRFDLAEYGRWTKMLSPWQRRSLQQIYGSSLPGDAPTEDDLWRLCGDKALDVIVLRQRFPGLFAASNGRWHVYDCAELRRRQATFVGMTTSATTAAQPLGQPLVPRIQALKTEQLSNLD